MHEVNTHLHTPIEESLVIQRPNPRRLEHHNEIVRYYVHAVPLGEEPERDSDEHAVAVSLCLDEAVPRGCCRHFLLALERGHDLLDFEVDNVVSDTPSMMLDQGVGGFIESVFGDVPARALGG